MSYKKLKRIEEICSEYKWSEAGMLSVWVYDFELIK